MTCDVQSFNSAIEDMETMAFSRMRCCNVLVSSATAAPLVPVVAAAAADAANVAAACSVVGDTVAVSAAAGGVAAMELTVGWCGADI